jgi:hypothetical protein
MVKSLRVFLHTKGKIYVNKRCSLFITLPQPFSTYSRAFWLVDFKWLIVSITSSEWLFPSLIDNKLLIFCNFYERIWLQFVNLKNCYFFPLNFEIKNNYRWKTYCAAVKMGNLQNQNVLINILWFINWFTQQSVSSQGAMTFSITTVSIMTFSIMGLVVTLSITDAMHNDTQHKH